MWKEKEVNLVIQEKVAQVSPFKKFTICPESHDGDIYIQTSFKFARCFFQLLLDRERTLAAIPFILCYAIAFIFLSIVKNSGATLARFNVALVNFHFYSQYVFCVAFNLFDL